MKKIFIAAAMLVLSACTYKMAVLMPGSTNLDFAVLVNIRENAVDDEREAKYMKKIKDQTEFDMYNRLKDRGVKVHLIKDKSEYVAGENNYLMQISFGKYLGETISRSLVMHYTLTNQKGDVVFDNDFSAATRRHWTSLVSSVNQKALINIDKTLSQSGNTPQGNANQVRLDAAQIKTN